ncbi:MAG TPA: divergent polysaccharide deacetylase family protein [Candidatus Marinimicrobia bacterium]|nr:divergent polysaccharide deacetylase family protein [Candidatus Neomarinimicrobiota bacterium]
MIKNQDDQALLIVFITFLALAMGALLLRYLWLDVTRQGEKAQAGYILEHKIIPALNARPYRYQQKGKLIRSGDYIRGAFVFPYDAPISQELLSYRRYLEIHGFSVSSYYDSDLDKYQLRIQRDNIEMAVLDLYRGRKQVAGQIAIIIDDFGYRYDETILGFLNLKPALTVSVIPGHQFSQTSARAGWEKGCEVLIHMPMEAIQDQGDGRELYYISIRDNHRQIMETVEKATRENPYAVGMNNHTGSRATAHEKTMKILARAIQKHNLFFVDSYTSAQSIAEITMRHYNIPTARRDVFLDNERTVEATLEKLEELAKIALENGSAIAIGHCHASTLKALKIFLPRLESYNLALVPVAKLLK